VEINLSGTDYTLPAGEEVRSVTVAKGSATILGDVRHDVVVTGGDLTVNGHVGDDVVNVFGPIHLQSNAKIDGSVVAIGGHIQRDEGAQVTGEVVDLGIQGLSHVGDWLHTDVPAEFRPWFHECFMFGRLLSPRVGWVWGVNVGFLIFYILLSLLFPGAVKSCRASISQRPLNTIALGIIGVPAILCAMLLLSLTVIGLIAWPFLIAATILASFFGKAALLTSFGSTLAAPFRRSGPLPWVLALLIGWGVISALYLIPYLSLALWLGLGLWGIGVALSTAFRSQPQSNKAPTDPSLRPNPPTDPIEPPIPPRDTPLQPEPEPVTSATVESVPPIPLVTSFAGPAGAFQTSMTPPSIMSTETTSSNPGSFGKTAASATAFAPRRESTDPEWTRQQARPKFLKRLGALAVDALVVGAVISILPIHQPIIALGLVVGYQWGMLHWRNATLGSILFHQKVVRLDGGPVDQSVAGVRAVASILSLLSCGLGWLWSQWDRDRQTWHDKLAGTVVIELERPEPLV
jgi:uncharacterized RDD family membrane protein YckC